LYNEHSKHVLQGLTHQLATTYLIMWTLTIRSPASEPRDYILKNGITILGRKTDNEIVISDESASRLHAEINCQADKITIQDLGSTNGTFVNRKRITSAQRLKSGDQIRIGHHLVSVSNRENLNLEAIDTTPFDSKPVTADLLLESYDQNAVLLYEVANRLTTVVDLDKALQEISNFLQVAIGAYKCHVILADQFDRFNELGFSKSIANRAIEQRSVVVYPDANLPKPISESSTLLEIRAALCIPVMKEQETVAIVYAYKTDPTARPFDQNDILLAVAGGHQAALAIQRTQILEKARVLEVWAFTDSLTGLDNRRQILKKGEIECSRSNRFKHPLAAIMVDIDNLKKVNDTYGHIIGDQVIQTVAQRCKQKLRDIDLLGRYGGDEFLVLLVETGLDEAVIVAEHIRRKIAEQPIDTDRGHLDITISMGISFISGVCLEVASLIKRADDALISAKAQGKNHFEVLY
jgi:diguanylate cyclase (GGDEF)-like protein